MATRPPTDYGCPMQRWFWILAGLNGFLAVALGAFGAHGLEKALQGLADSDKRLDWWHTAAHYHLVHALALGLAAYLSQKAAYPATIAGLSFQAGIVLFAGSLYTMTLTGARWLGAVTPLGGLLFLVGWAAVTWCGIRMRI